MKQKGISTVLDLNRTFSLIKGALLDPGPTWRAYLPEADNWQKTAFLLTGPLIILAAVLGYVIGLLGSGAYVVGFRPTIGMTLLSIVSGAIAAGIIPIYLEVPAGKRVGHYILTLIATVLVIFLISILLRPIIGPEMSGLGDYPDVQSPDGRASSVGGVMSGVDRDTQLPGCPIVGIPASLDGQGWRGRCVLPVWPDFALIRQCLDRLV